MTVDEILAKLASLGNAKMRAIHQKNGAADNVYGVKTGDIRALAKSIKSNHALGLALWQTGNVDAQLLAILIMQPKMLNEAQLNSLVDTITLAWVADWLTFYIIKEHPENETLRQQWMATDRPWAARAGWSLTAGAVVRNPEQLNMDALLERIEKEMPNASPEVQWTMNTTLAQIGIHHPAYRAQALQIGESLGIYKNYPVSKGCTSPFAPIWINEMVGRQEKQPD